MNRCHQGQKNLLLVSLDKDIITLIKQHDSIHLIGFLDKMVTAYDSHYPNLGDDTFWPILKEKYPGLEVVLAIDPPRLKKKLTDWYGLDNLTKLIGKSCILETSIPIGQGTIIQDRAYVSRDVRIGLACKINVNAALHHDVYLGNYSTVAPGAQLLGRVKVGECCYIGSGAIVLPNITIGNHVVIGAGSVVTKDIKEGMTVVGVPAKSL